MKDSTKYTICTVALVAGLGLATSGIVANYSRENESSQPVCTNELLGLAKSENNSSTLYSNSKGEIECKVFRSRASVKITKNLPNDAKPTITIKGLEKMIQLPSNAQFKVSANRDYDFELIMPQTGDTQ